MPLRPLHGCAQPGCPELVRDTARCPEHTKQRRVEVEHRYKDKADKSFYASAPWRKLRRLKLSRDPLCQCGDPNCHEVADTVHHVKPRKQYPELQLVLSNLESLCKRHHDSKTAAEVLHS